MDYKELIQATIKNGGATFNPAIDNFLSGQYYCVAMYPEKETIIPLENFNEESLKDFMIANFILLQDRRNSLGTWLDVDTDNVYLDISRTLKDKETALKIAKKYNQLAIFDLENLKEIRL